MPQHLHQYLSLKVTDSIKVNLQGRAHVMLMDDRNYELYNSGEDFDFFGKTAKRSPCVIAPPFGGDWHLVIEQADPTTDIMAHVQIISQKNR
jgi:hypothetical protein